MPTDEQIREANQVLTQLSHKLHKLVDVLNRHGRYGVLPASEVVAAIEGWELDVPPIRAGLGAVFTENAVPYASIVPLRNKDGRLRTDACALVDLAEQVRHANVEDIAHVLSRYIVAGADQAREDYADVNLAGVHERLDRITGILATHLPVTKAGKLHVSKRAKRTRKKK